MKLGDDDVPFFEPIGEHHKGFLVQYYLNRSYGPGFKALGGFGSTGHPLVDPRWNLAVD